MAERRKIIALAAFGCIVLRIAAATPVTVTVGDVTALTNKIATVASGSTILLEKGVYDISECRGYLMSTTFSNGCISVRDQLSLTLAGAPGTTRGDVVITAPTADRRMLYVNKGSLACTNITFAGASHGAIHLAGNGLAALRLGNCVFSNLTSSSSAAVSRYYPKSDTRPVNEFSNCLFADCHATNGGTGAHTFRGGNAYDCVYTNCTCTGSGGATTSGNYVRCRFYDCSTSSMNTARGGGAIGSDYDENVGFCTDCEFVGCATTGGRDPSTSGSAHGAAIQKATALTNCVFRNNLALWNEIVGSAGEIIGCVFEGNASTNVICGSSSNVANTVFLGNVSQGTLFQSSPGIVANTLVASNTCTTTKGVFTSGTFVNCTFIGNTCKEGSIVGAGCMAVNCLFYQNMANGAVWRDMAMCFTDNTLSSAMSPHMTNCVWTAELSKTTTHTEAAYARTKNCQLLSNLELNVLGLSDTTPFYEMPRVEFIRSGGLAADDIRAAVGERDLAGNRRFAENGTISIGCYQHTPTHFKITLR